MEGNWIVVTLMNSQIHVNLALEESHVRNTVQQLKVIKKESHFPPHPHLSRTLNEIHSNTN